MLRSNSFFREMIPKVINLFSCEITFGCINLQASVAEFLLKALLENYSLYTRQVHISFVFLWLRETATVGTNYHHPRRLIEASWGIWSFLTQLTKSNHALCRRRRNRMLPSESGIGGKYAVIYCRSLRIGGGSGRLLSSSEVLAESSSSSLSSVDPESTYVSSELEVEVSEAGERSRRLILKLGSLTRRPLLARSKSL